MTTANSSKTRPRTIIWTPEADAKAVDLARERGYLPDRTNGGVSQLLSDLVLKEAANTPALHEMVASLTKQMGELDQKMTQIEKKASKK